MTYKDFVDLVHFLEKTRYLASIKDYKTIQEDLKNLETSCRNFFYQDGKPNPQIIRFYRNMLNSSTMSYYYRFFHYFYAWINFWADKLPLMDIFLLAIVELYEEFYEKTSIDNKFKHFAFLFYLAYLKTQEKIPQAFSFLKEVDIFPQVYSQFYRDLCNRFYINLSVNSPI
ncbi:MAG: hypothetical protein QXT86_11485 [Archaeoglobaceae archaeon]